MTDKVLAIIADVLAGNPMAPRPEVLPEHDLRADLGCDAIDLHEIAMEMEDAFGVEISDAAMERWERVADVIASVEGAKV